MVMQDIHFDKDVQVYRIFLFHLLFLSLFHHIAFGKIGLYFFLAHASLAWHLFISMLFWHGLFWTHASLAWHLFIFSMLFWNGLFLYSPILLLAEISRREVYNIMEFLFMDVYLFESAFYLVCSWSWSWVYEGYLTRFTWIWQSLM